MIQHILLIKPLIAYDVKYITIITKCIYICYQHCDMCSCKYIYEKCISTQWNNVFITTVTIAYYAAAGNKTRPVERLLYTSQVGDPKICSKINMFKLTKTSYKGRV